MEAEDIIEKKHGDGTARAARFLAKHLAEKPYSIASDHGAESDESIGHIVSRYFSQEGWKTPLSQIDIVVLDQSNPRRALALIEIEETNSRPKNLLGDVFSILLGNEIRYKGETFPVGNWTTLIVIAKGPERHDKERNAYLSQAAKQASAALGNDNSQLGEILIRSFDDNQMDLILETVLKEEVEKALERVRTL